MTHATGTTPVEAVMIENPAGEGDALVVTLPETTPEADPETVAESVVDIIEAQSDADVALAEIHAETERQRIAADSEGNEQWQDQMQGLRAEISALGEAVTATAAVVESLLAPSIPPALEPETVTVTADPETMTELLETTPETPSSEETESQSESREESPVETVAQLAGKRVRVRMI